MGTTYWRKQCSTVKSKILHGDMQNMVLMGETMVEKKTGTSSREDGSKRKNQIRLISGPSSAGKTTFSRRLAIHLKILGKNPVALSMDDFFKNREDTPKLADGSYDFECLEALDVPLYKHVLKNSYRKKKYKCLCLIFKKGKENGEKNRCV